MGLAEERRDDVAAALSLGPGEEDAAVVVGHGSAVAGGPAGEFFEHAMRREAPRVEELGLGGEVVAGDDRQQGEVVSRTDVRGAQAKALHGVAVEGDRGVGVGDDAADAFGLYGEEAPGRPERRLRLTARVPRRERRPVDPTPQWGHAAPWPRGPGCECTPLTAPRKPGAPSAWTTLEAVQPSFPT